MFQANLSASQRIDNLLKPISTLADRLAVEIEKINVENAELNAKLNDNVKAVTSAESSLKQINAILGK